jgi:hypothetical protein
MALVAHLPPHPTPPPTPLQLLRQLRRRTSRPLRPIAPLLHIIPLQARRTRHHNRRSRLTIRINRALDIALAIVRVRVEAVLGSHAVRRDDLGRVAGRDVLGHGYTGQ